MAQVTPEYVQALYNTYLGRSPSQDEINLHVNGGFGNNPQGLEMSVANSPEAIKFVQSGGVAEGGEEFGFEFPMFEFPTFEPSEEELRYQELLIEQIEQQIRLQEEENARVEERRAFLESGIQEAYGISLEEFEAQESLRAAGISREQAIRLEQALKGELPVDPALEDQIEQDREMMEMTMAQQLGPGWETSTPGIQAVEEFEQGKEELLYAARHGEIEQGIAPASATAQYGLSLIGNQGFIDTTPISQGLQLSTQQRQASTQAAQAQANAAYQMAQLQFQYAEMANKNRLAAITPSPYASGSSGATPTYGAGAGAAAGTGLGIVASQFFQQPKATDPLYV